MNGWTIPNAERVSVWEPDGQKEVTHLEQRERESQFRKSRPTGNVAFVQVESKESKNQRQHKALSKFKQREQRERRKAASSL